ncbi:MAG: hypothetical protein JW891_15805 [Candidatus Lokiarchaeota archaeon]|nr:hypothetical protein [Candidatus Lokiarchaeota archaeon]
MNNTKIKKSLLLVLLVFFPAGIFLGFMTPSVVAATPVPEPSIYNQWAWHDDIIPDTKIIYDEETTVLNQSNNQILTQYKIRKILNITEIKNITLDGTTDYPPYGNTSAIYGTECYWNCTSGQFIGYNMTDVYRDNETEEEIPIAMFGYNDTKHQEHYIGYYRSPLPIIVPLNASVLELSTIAQIMNDTYLGIYSEMGFINSFESLDVYPMLNKISFRNILEGYYLNVSFFDNGTIDSIDAEYLMKLGESSDPMIQITTKIRRVFDLDLVNQVSWDFMLGDDYYFGENSRWYDNGSDGINYNELKITIIDINTTLAPVYASWGFPYLQCFQQVFADISIWNVTNQQYELVAPSMLIGMANNMNPVNLMVLMGEGNMLLQDYPIASIDGNLNLSIGGFHPNYPTWVDKELEILDMDGKSMDTYYRIENVYDNGTHINIQVEDKGPGEGLIDRGFNTNNRINIHEKQEGPHFFFYPQNTQIDDVEFVLVPFMYQFMKEQYDTYSFDPDGTFSFSTSSSTNLREMKGKYNIATGILEWMISNDDMGNPMSVIFRKNCTSIFTSTTTQIQLYPSNVYHNGLGSAELYLDLTTSNSVDIYSAVLPFNPVLTPFYGEILTMPLYLDLYASYDLFISSANLTIEYDETLLNGFNEEYLWPYLFSMEERRWMPAPEYAFIRDTATNTITTPLSQTGGLLRNVSYFALGAGKEWSWAINQGDIYTYLTQGTVSNGSELMPYNDFTTYNVTFIGDIYDHSQMWSIVNASGMHHDGISGLIPNGWPPMTFGQISTNGGSLTMILGPYSWGIPSIVPVQYGSLNLSAVGIALMAFYGSIYELPSFNNMTISGNNLYMSEYGTSYYLNLTFYANGTLNEFDLHTRVMTMEIELQGRQIFDPNPVNEMSWGVNPGETYYYGNPDQRVMIQISNTTEIQVVNLQDMHLSFNDASLCAFRLAEANIFRWDVTSMSWQSLGTRVISWANEYFLFTFNASLDLSPNPEFFLLPQGTTGASLYAFIEPIMALTGSDTVVLMENDHLRIESSTSEAFFDWSFNSLTGVTQLIVGRIPSHEYPGEYEMFGRYLMEYQSRSGTTTFNFNNPFADDITTSVVLETSGIVDMYFAIFNDVPGGITIGNGTMVFYCDFLVTGIQSGDSLTVTIGLPDTIDLSQDFSKLKLWVWDSYAHDWEDVTEDLLSSLITENTDSALILDFMEAYENGVIDLVFAITIDEEAFNEENRVPGFTMAALLLAISLGALSIYLVKRKRIKYF